MVRGAADKEATNIQAKSFMARNMEKYFRRSATQRKTKVGYRKKKKFDTARKSRGIHFVDLSDAEFNSKRAAKVGSSDASIYASRDQEKQSTGRLVALLARARENMRASLKPTTTRKR